MGDEMNRLCTICVRAGSKGVANKNVRMLNGKPLFVHSILQAKKSGLFQAVAVSSDSTVILKIAKQWGANFVIQRPAELAQDNSPKIPAVRHCLMETERMEQKTFDIIVDLDATSPLRGLSDIAGAVELLETARVSNVITGTPARRSPYFNLAERKKNGTVKLCKTPRKPVYCRQDSPECYDLNASVYVWQREALLRSDTVFNEDTRLFVMPPERSVDIDSELDFAFVQFLMSKRVESLGSDIL